MTSRKFTCWLISACALVAPGIAYGQAADAFCDFNCYHEQQWFAPVDFDFDCLPIERECGYYFSVEKLSWATTGERTPVGNGGTDDATLAPFRNFLTGHAGDLGIPPNPANLLTRISVLAPDFSSGVESGPPRAEFAWGERYELGYFNGDNGWKIGVLDGGSAGSFQNYGFDTQDELYGSVLVVFDDPQNLMFGFIDVIDALGGAFQPDGLADDIDNDGQFGPDGFDSDAPGREPDVIFAPDNRGDFDDLVRLPTSFQTLTVKSDMEADGVELMKTYRLKNDHMMKKDQNNEFEVGVGVRYLRLRDEFRVNGTGGVMGQSFWDTFIDNNLVGPQISANWTHRKKRLQYDLGGRFLFGYNIQNFDQNVGFGQAPRDAFGFLITDQSLLPGQYNRPLYFPPTVADHGKQEQSFSPTGELRATASYRVTSALALKLGYTAIFVDNISRSANNVKYELPAMGFREEANSKQYILMNGVNFGVDLTF